MREKKLFIVINKAKTTPILPNSKLMRAFKEIADVLSKLYSWSSYVLLKFFFILLNTLMDTRIFKFVELVHFF